MTASNTPVTGSDVALPHAQDLASEFLDRSTPLSRLRALLHRYPALSPAFVLVLSVVVFAILNPRFFSPNNLSLVTQQVAVVGTLSAAQTLIVLTAGIDLSVGAAMVLVSLVMAQTAAQWGFAGPLALLVGLVAGAATGALNGVLVTRVKLQPFIVTLGTLSIFTALALWYSAGTSTQSTSIPDIISFTGVTFNVAGIDITSGVVIMVVLYAVLAFVLTRTGWGRHVYAVGDDREAARLTGIGVTKLLFSVYIVAGLIIAVAGWVQIGRAAGADPNAAGTLNLDSVTAVVIGGTSLFGGRGTIWGSLLGALIVGVFENGLAIAGLDDLFQILAVGTLVIVAVALDQWIRKARS